MISLLEIKNILIINPFGIGDVLFTTPLIASIEEDSPACTISYLCNARTADLIYNNPNVDNVFVYDRDEWCDSWKKSKLQYFIKLRKFLKSLKEKKFDLAIDLSLSSNYSFWLWLIGIKKRIGYNYKNRAFFINYKIPLKGYSDKHIVEHYLDLLKFIGLKPKKRKLELYLSNDYLSWAEGFLSAHNVSFRDLLIAVFPAGGASWGKDATIKHWSLEGFSQVINNLVEKFNAKVIICGSNLEKELCDKVFNLSKNDKNVINGCAKTSLMQSAAILSKCKLILSNDGGPLHMAVALGKKTVSIFGPVDEIVYGPYPPEGHIVIKKDLGCRPCYKNFRMPKCPFDRKCLTEINSGEVFKAVESLL